MEANLPTWVYIIVALGGVVAAFIPQIKSFFGIKGEREKGWAEANKTNAEAESIAIKSIREVIDTMREQFKEQLCDMEKEIQALKNKLEKLQKQLDSTNGLNAILKDRLQYAIYGWRACIGQLVENDLKPEEELPLWAEEDDK